VGGIVVETTLVPSIVVYTTFVTVTVVGAIIPTTIITYTKFVSTLVVCTTIV
jgi:hypothetical protein